MDLSIIIPVYNSESILPHLVKEIDIALIDKNLNKELIFINDFSEDKSWKTIKHLSTSYSFIKGINLKSNYGQHNAIAAGLNHASGKYIIMMDDDLQHDPKYILKIFNELKNGYDSCYVKYLLRKHKIWKKTLSYFNHISSSYLSGKPISIYTSSFKGIRNEICNKINNDHSFEVFLDWIIVENSKRIQTIEILHRERFDGKTNYSIKKLLLLWSNMILKIKPKNKFKMILLLFVKFIINFIILKIIKKKDFKEKFIIIEKTF